MSKMSREKGKRGEREVAEILRNYGFDGRRGVQYHGGPDSPDVVGLPGFHIEVKRTESFRLYEALEQSEEDCNKVDGLLMEMPIVVHRKNDKPWVAVMYFDDLLSYISMRDIDIKLLNATCDEEIARMAKEMKASDDYTIELQNRINELEHELSEVEEDLDSMTSSMYHYQELYEGVCFE